MTGLVELPRAEAGVHEFVFGAEVARRDALLAFWKVLGFEPVEEGRMAPDAAEAFYGHRAELTSLRLAHPGCRSFETGYVRLQLWSDLRDQGLGDAPPITVGSRWMGLYTHDILQLRDSFCAEGTGRDWNIGWISPLVSAPLEKPPPEVGLERPFVGLRETLVFAEEFRLAFIQRGGFDRPGFGTFDDTLAFKNTEGSHANIVQPAGRFSTDFYKRAFAFETAPYGEAHDSGDEAPTIAALKLRDGETFRVERTRAADCPSGLLQVYASYLDGDDLRDRSRPGCKNLCAYTVRLHGDALEDSLARAGAAVTSTGAHDEFGRRAVAFDAPDGYAWIALQDVA